MDRSNVTGSNLTIDVNTYITTNIRVKSGYTLKIESGASLYIHPSTHFIVESGGILQLESGNIKICSDVTWQGSLTVETGGQMLIEGTCVIEINN